MGKKTIKKRKFERTMKRISVGILLVMLLFVLEPVLRGKDIFAITYLGNPISYEQNNQMSVEFTQTPIKKTFAPEPSSFLLILGGIGGIIISFVRRSFDKIKRGLDLILAIIGLIIGSPLLILAAIFIKIDSRGPIVYQQNRVGRRGKIFKIYKLRTMRLDAEKGTGAVWAKRNDPRITEIGKFLRKTRIDEIPQLINVLKGEMSIVGPRPERPEMVVDFKKLICDYEKRLIVKPGITGLSQIYNRYDETIADVRKKVKYDLLYIRKMCLWVEMRILAQTVFVVFTGKGAN
jgi:lipopolysaccharide/colanic/teichoic acid biosynthesis glycosyltransferase